MSCPKICKITPEEYQDTLTEVSKTFKVYSSPNRLPTYCLGLAGETGEVMELIKRYFREGIEPDREHLLRELGDVLAYVTLLCNHYGLSLEDVMIGNITKLKYRQEHKTLEGSGSDR